VDGAWAANNVDGADIANAGDPLKGAALVGYDGTNIAAQINMGRRVLNYSAIQAYSGSASRLQVVAPDIFGEFQDLGVAGAPLVQGMFIKGANDHVWGRIYSGAVESSWFGTVGDGIADDTAAFQAWWSFLSTYGLVGHVKRGRYAISAQCLTTLTENMAVYCDPDCEFLATIGFPSAAAMFALGNAVTTEKKTFKWIGGRMNGVNQPFTLAGSGSGCALLTVNASNCSNCHIELDRTYTGDDWLHTGGDSHLFIGGPSNVYARIYEAVGAPDSAIYCSRNFAGTVGESLDVGGNFYKCMVGVIIKRRYETVKCTALGVDCVTVAATGTADISTEAITNAGSGYVFEVNAKRCQNPLFLQAVRGVRATVNVDKLGVVIPGYTAADGAGVRFRGASDCQVTVNVSGLTTGITQTVDFAGAYFGPITITAGTVDSINNHVTMNVRGPGRAFTEEGSGSNNNTVVGKFDGGITNVPLIVGANTKFDLQIGSLRLTNADFRRVDNAGNIVWDAAATGSQSWGARNTGVAAPVFLDFYTSGGATRNARMIVTGGSGTADSGVLAFQAGQTNFTGAAVDITGVLRAAVDIVASVGQKARRFLAGYFQTLFIGTGDALITSGSGSPEGVVTAPKGSLYTNTGTGVTIWYKASGAGNTGWVALSST
jgi:hypothetical protein